MAIAMATATVQGSEVQHRFVANGTEMTLEDDEGSPGGRMAQSGWNLRDPQKAVQKGRLDNLIGSNVIQWIFYKN